MRQVFKAVLIWLLIAALLAWWLWPMIQEAREASTR